jgi:hypothetical protein
VQVLLRTVYSAVSVRGVVSRALAAAALVASAFLLIVGSARADTTFGGNPNAAVVVPGATCEATVSVFHGAPTCTWWWQRLGQGGGSDIVPIPVTGGSGVITSVTLPAMPHPGTMQVVVLTAALAASNNPAIPDYICCQVKTLGPTFTVPPNQVTTVPQSLAVSATKEANLSNPGETSFGDLVAISTLTPGASIPVRYTGNTNIAAGGDAASVYFPAPTATSGEFTQMPPDPAGYEMMASFTLGATPTAAPAPAPAPAPGPAPKTGVKLGGNAFAPGGDGKTLGLGKATNPPTAATTQTLTLPTGAARASAVGGKAKKPVVLGKGKTVVPAGKSAPIKLKLNSKALAKLSRGHSLKATLTIVATNAQGESQTVTKSVTIKPPKRKN